MSDTSRATWLLYGAYGYTGRLLAAEALERGHRPILAGRDATRLAELALELATATGGEEPDWRAFPLDDAGAVEAGLSGVAAVIHAAGPFIHTAPPMVGACLASGVHYLDITGEIPVFEALFDLSGQARDRGVVLMPGVGMDVVPTDGLAALLKERLPTATRLEIAVHSPSGPSRGTLRTVLEHLPGGLLVRRDGRLEHANPGRREFRRSVDMGPRPDAGPMARVLGGSRPVAPYTWGDLSTAYRTTGVGNITCYLVTPRLLRALLPVLLPVARLLLAPRPVRRFLQRRLTGGSAGPDERRRHVGRTRVWGRVQDDDGRSAEAVLELPEAYRFTAEAGVRAVEEVLRRTAPDYDLPPLAGTLTPAGAFGHDWVMSLPGVHLVLGA